MTNTTNTANSRFAVAYGSAFLYGAVVFFWESLRPSADPYLRGESVIASVVCFIAGYRAISGRKQPRPAPTTRYPRATVAVSLFPFGLAVGLLWYFARSGDLFYLLAAPPILALGIWGVVVGWKKLKQRQP